VKISFYYCVFFYFINFFYINKKKENSILTNTINPHHLSKPREKKEITIITQKKNENEIDSKIYRDKEKDVNES
jgi:hypothetical protein